MDVLFIRTHNWLTLVGGQLDRWEPLPASLLEAMAKQLTYDKITPLFGAARRRIDPATGDTYTKAVEIEQHRLWYRDDTSQSFNCPLGFLNRLWDLTVKCGYTPVLIDQTPEDPEKWKPDWDHLASRMSLRELQQPALEATLEQYSSILEAAPGFGKSYMIAAYGLLLRKLRIAVVTKQLVNVHGLRQDISKFLPCGQVCGGVKDYRRLTVYSADSLSHYRHDADLLIGDEIHQLSASTYSRDITQQFDKCRRIGLTATPHGRGDNTDLRTEAMWGQTAFKVSYQQAQALRLVTPIEVRWQSMYLDQDPAAGISHPVFRHKAAIHRNTVRNVDIARVARLHPDEQVLILVDRARHSLLLKQLLPEFTLVFQSVAPAVWRECHNEGLIDSNFAPPTAHDLLRYRDAFKTGELRKVIATNMWSTGVSFDQLSVLIRADGQAGFIIDTQAPPRTSRLYDGKVAVVYDWLDQFSSIYRGRAKRRGKTYEEHGWTQVFPHGIHSTERV